MVDCTPDPNLLESMRSVGYSLNTAVADIIDNSIAAHAKTISIRYFDHGEDPYVAIIDDGDGMDYETAVNAMKLAGTNPERQAQCQRSRPFRTRFEDRIPFTGTFRHAFHRSARTSEYAPMGSGPRRTNTRWDLETLG
mgnify:CR=1 FL=1